MGCGCGGAQAEAVYKVTASDNTIQTFSGSPTEARTKANAYASAMGGVVTRAK